MEQPDDKELMGILFSQLVISLTEATMVHLGKVIHPAAQAIQRDLNQARATIDMLRMLKEKTQGNLDEAEKKLIEQSLLTLQMNFVYEQEQDQKPKTKTDPLAAKPTTETSETMTPPEEIENLIPEADKGNDDIPGNRPGEAN
jgi:hypothetical protein